MRIRCYVILIIIVSSICGWRFSTLKNETGIKQPYKRYSGVIITQAAVQRFSCIFTVNDVIVEASTCPKYVIGDRVRISGTFKASVTGIYQAENRLIAKEIELVEAFDEISIEEKVLKYPDIIILRKIQNYRSELLRRINRLFLQPQSGLLSGMLLGAKDTLSSGLNQSVKISGLAHLVVASGGNIAIITTVTFSTLSLWLSRRKSILVTYMCIGTYLLLAGLEPPLIRAALMAGLSMVGHLIGRKTSGVWILMLTVLTMVFVNPLLLTSLSFHLSVAATSGIVLFATPLQNYLNHMLNQERTIVILIKSLVTIVIQSVAAQLMVVPLLIHSFGSVNMFSLLANFLAAPFVTPIMVGGLCVLAVSYVWWPLAEISSWGLSFLLEIVIVISEMFSKEIVVSLKLPLSWNTVFLWWGVCLTALVVYRSNLGRNRTV